MKNIKVKPQFEPAIKHLEEELKGLRTGRASSGLVENLNVDYYGTQTRLRDMASINVVSAQTIQIEPWDKSAVQNIVKAIESSSLGLNPAVSGNIIRLNIPQLTEERRKELAKAVGKYIEDAKIVVRNIRERHLKDLKNKMESKEISEDQHKRERDVFQKDVDEALVMIDELGKEKEVEILAV